MSKILEKLGENRAEELGLVDVSGIAKYQLPTRFKQVIEKSPGTARQYLAHPDLAVLSGGRIVLSYVQGHGKGPIIMRISDDDGETFVEKPDLPESWQNSYETPTIYTLNFSDGREWLILISGCPAWEEGEPSGFFTSISKDGAQTWSEFKHFHERLESGEKNITTVAMASLIRMQDGEGNAIDRWIGVYHNGHDFKNYMTILSFDEKGEEQWSEPRAYLSEYRELEELYQICEVCLLRKPGCKEILALARTQAHNANSTYFLSEDEGLSWTKPRETSLALTGERHKGIYLSQEKKFCLTFREIIRNGDRWAAGDWLAWIGKYEDLLKAGKGEYRILLGKDYTQNTYGGDTGYAGIVLNKLGQLVLAGYGHFSEEFSKAWQGDTREDLSYILGAKFSLPELENYINAHPESELN